jgi:hypothetical protein
MTTDGRDEASYKQFLEQKVQDQETEIAGLQAQIAQLKKQRGIASAREGLSFSQRTGIWAEPSGLCYCPKCLDKDKRNPLRVEAPYGWRCGVCDSYYDNPDSPPPAPIVYDTNRF